MTYRESAQFIDELRQHYRRLDGLLVKHKDKLGPIEAWEFNHPVIALRKLLFGGVGDPNFASSTQPQVNACQVNLRTQKDADAFADILAAGVRHVRGLRLVEDAPTAPMSVHDPAEDLEVIP